MPLFIGIDISSKSFDLVVRKQNKSKSFEQSFDGHQSCLKKLKPTLIVMEATGVYYLDLAVHLYNAGLPVAVINPASFKRFAELMLKQSKTDSIDAALLAEFAQRMEPRLWVAPSEQCLALKDLGRQVQRLTADKAKAKNRLHAFQSKKATLAILVKDMVKSIDSYEKRISLLTDAALEIIHNDEALSRQFQSMMSAKGIGQTSAIAILAEFSILPKEMKAKQVSRGKKKIQAIIAVMRKYLTGLWSVYLSGETFDSSKLFSPIHKKA